MFVYCETSNKRPIAFIADSAFIVTATAIVRVFVIIIIKGIYIAQVRQGHKCASCAYFILFSRKSFIPYTLTKYCISNFVVTLGRGGQLIKLILIN